MAKNLSPERRRLVGLSGGVAVSSAVLPLLHAHPRGAVVWMMLEAGALGDVIWSFVTSKRVGLRRSGNWGSR